MIPSTLLRNPYAIGVLGILLVGGIQQARVWKSQSAMSACMSDLAQQREAWAESSRAGEKAAREAVEAAVLLERERQAQRTAQEAEAAERLREAAEKAAREAADWQRRYREAVREDASCRDWSEARVQCPLD